MSLCTTASSTMPSAAAVITNGCVTGSIFIRSQKARVGGRPQDESVAARHRPAWGLREAVQLSAQTYLQVKPPFPRFPVPIEAPRPDRYPYLSRVRLSAC